MPAPGAEPVLELVPDPLLEPEPRPDVEPLPVLLPLSVFMGSWLGADRKTHRPQHRNGSAPLIIIKPFCEKKPAAKAVSLARPISA